MEGKMINHYGQWQCSAFPVLPFGPFFANTGHAVSAPILETNQTNTLLSLSWLNLKMPFIFENSYHLH